jgi:hypothetical protein
VTLPGWLTSARTTVDEAITAQSSRQKHETAAEAQAALNESLADLTALQTAVQTARDAGWLDGVPDHHGAGPAVAALLSKGPQRAEVNRLQTALPRFADQAKRTVTDAWTARIRSEVGGIDDLLALAEVLGRIPGHQGQQDKLTRALQPVRTLMRSLPAPTSEKELKSAAEQVDAAFNDAFGDTEVRQFLLAASRSGARLDQLTPTVLTWIQQNKAADLVRVSIGSAP